MQITLRGDLAYYKDFADTQMKNAGRVDEKFEGTDVKKYVGKEAILDVSGGVFQRSITKDAKGQIDHYAFLGRTKTQKANNNETRSKFLNAVIAHYGSYAAVPKKVLSALKISKFSLDSAKAKEGEYVATSGKPLTVRRINAVIDAMNADAIDKANAKISALSKDEGAVVQAANDCAKNIASLISAHGNKSLLTIDSNHSLLGGVRASDTKQMLKNGIMSSLNNLVEAIRARYNVRTKDVLNKKQIIAQMAEKLAGLTFGSACNCHVIGHKELAGRNTIYALFGNLLQTVELTQNQRDTVLKDMGISFVEGLLREVCGLPRETFDRGEMLPSQYDQKIAQRLLVKEKESYLTEIANLGGYEKIKSAKVRDQKLIKLNNILYEAKDVYQNVSYKAGTKTITGMFRNLRTIDPTKVNTMEDLKNTFFAFLSSDGSYMNKKGEYLSGGRIDHEQLDAFSEKKGVDDEPVFTTDEMRIICKLQTELNIE